MAKEVLVIPEENLKEVIFVIRHGILSAREMMFKDEFFKAYPPSERPLSENIEKFLLKWCDDMEDYLSDNSSDG